MSLRDDLIAARALIDTPERWRKDGKVFQPSCCAVIACQRVTDRRVRDGELAVDALYVALPVGRKTPYDERDKYGEIVGSFNDSEPTTHADILDLFDRAIEAAT